MVEPDQTTKPIDRFKQAAHDLERDENEARWDATLKKVANYKPAPEPEKPV